jgi:hypothetical protein
MGHGKIKKAERIPQQEQLALVQLLLIFCPHTSVAALLFLLSSIGADNLLPITDTVTCFCIAILCVSGSIKFPHMANILWRNKMSHFVSRSIWSFATKNFTTRSYRFPRLILFGVGSIGVPITAALGTAYVKEEYKLDLCSIYSAQILSNACFNEISRNVGSLIRSTFTARTEAKLQQECKMIEIVEALPESLSENIRSSAVMGALVLSCTVVVPALFVGFVSVPFLYGLKPFALLVMLFSSLQLIPVRYSRKFIETGLISSIFKITSQYFAPFRVLRPAAELDNSKTYVIALHPHGRLFIGSALIQGLFHTWFPELWKTQNLFVGINDAMFLVPVFGKLLQLLGAVSVGRASVNRVLDSGNSIMIVPGGIDEILEGTFDDKEVLFLAKRKGFCRVAMQHNSGVVPCFCFGESALFLHDSRLRSPARFHHTSKHRFHHTS